MCYCARQSDEMKKIDFLLLLDGVLDLEPGTLKGGEDLANFTWDSMKFLEFITLVDQRFEFTLSPDDLVKSKTVDDLTDLVKTHLTD
jgi:acyl carrier protein